ncbi:MAG: NAD(P)-dependent oxidoreductase, partial [Coriobacteriales bacterium]|nr:NAD(P)-dependent oxidoreductase [Coriobacteriales bacterium]
MAYRGRVLLTGCGKRGFVGHHIRRYLSDKLDLIATDSDTLDLRDYDAVKRFIYKNKIESVILSAATADLDTNLRMYFNIAALSGELDKIINFSSGAEYNKKHDIVMVSEEDVGNSIPEDPYGFAKYVITQHARKVANIFTVRLFSIFGVGEDWRKKFISNLCCKAIFNLPLSIRRECKFEFTPVDTLPLLVEWMLDSQPLHKDYNFVSGKPIALTEIAKMVNQISGKNLGIVLLDKDGQDPEYSASNNRLLQELPWLKMTPLSSA